MSAPAGASIGSGRAIPHGARGRSGTAERSGVADRAPVDGRQGWIVTAAGSAVTAAVLGVFGTVGVLVDPLAAELGVARGRLVPLFGVALLVHSVLAPLAGRTCDRRDPRPLLVASAVAAASGLSVTAVTTDHRVVLAGYGAGLGAASACVWVATSAAVSSWFVRQRAAALGVLSASGGVGGMLLAPVMALLAQARGPRATCLALAAGCAAVCLAGAVLIRRRPQRPPTAPVTVPAPREAQREAQREAPRAGVASDALHRVVAAAAVSSFAAFLPVVHLAGQAADAGLSATEAAAVLSLLGAVSAAARVAIGLLGRALGLLALYQVCHLVMAAALALWACTGPEHALPTFMVFAVVFGLGYGGWLALGPALLAAICPARRLGRALGLLGATGGLAGFAGPLLAAPLLTAARPATLLAGSTILVAGALLLPRRR